MELSYYDFLETQLLVTQVHRAWMNEGLRIFNPRR